MVDAKVLLVDDELPVLEGYRRILHREFPVRIAVGADEALAAMQADGPFAVVISDMRMPGMNGAQFLAEVRQKWPATVRMLLTGYTDLEAAIAAVNESRIFRYLTKPCEKDVLVEAIRLGVEAYRSAVAEKELVKKAKLLVRSDAAWNSADLSEKTGLTESLVLPGPEEAMAYLQEIFSGERDGYAVLLKLTLRNMIEERYGEETAVDYLKNMATTMLRGMAPADRLFHWSRQVLLMVVNRRLSPLAVRLEISRLNLDNPQFILEVKGRKIMIANRVAFDLLPISMFPTVEEMFDAFGAKLSGKL
jgi:DNA-binding NarL/FixJ family response regulator